MKQIAKPVVASLAVLVAVACGKKDSEGTPSPEPRPVQTATSTPTPTVAPTKTPTAAPPVQPSVSPTTTPNPTPAVVDLGLEFAATRADKKVNCGEVYLEKAGQESKLGTLRFFVHDVLLKDDAGHEAHVSFTEKKPFQSSTDSLVSLSNIDEDGACLTGDAEIHTKLTFQAVGWNWSEVSFKVGVPTERNEPKDNLDAIAPLGKAFPNMSWMWRGGHRHWNYTSQDGEHNLHVGKNKDAVNNFQVTLKGFNLGKDTVAVELQKAIDAVELADMNCHSVPEKDKPNPSASETKCKSILSHFGFFDGTQQVFSKKSGQ